MRVNTFKKDLYKFNWISGKIKVFLLLGFEDMI